MERKEKMSLEVAQASEAFDQFCSASTLKTILGHHRHLCELLPIMPTTFPHFYPKLKEKLRSWKAQALWAKFDKRASHKCYSQGKACPNTRVLIIGAGPCGLRTAIEAQLLGAKVVVVEKRDRYSRNNVLHLWPFVITDLKALNAKKFFGKFCAGAIDHISIRQLQCILLKVALILGVEVHESVGFEKILTPSKDQSGEKVGWHAEVSPTDHPVSQYEFDVLIGADGKRNTLEGFKRKEFRGKLAIAITVNFINRHTEAEARVQEISGVAFIFNQKFFKDLYADTGIDLENIVYYKDETHYFVMTAKKHSLIDKGVILQDYSDTARLLSPENVNKTALQEYARAAADFSTNYCLPQLEFAVNHYGQPDMAMFDFTSMFAAENASRVIERQGYRLLQILVGDSLLEPFWPTGSGCARGFLSSLDACWAIKSWGSGYMSPLDVLAERESIYRILGQTTPENLHRNYADYTLDPHTRYPNLNARCVTAHQVRSLYDTDDPTSLEQPPMAIPHDTPKKRRRKDSQVHPDTLLQWLKKQVALYDSVHVEDMTTSFKDGMVLCAIIHRYRPDLLDFHALEPEDVALNNQLAFDTLERELGVPPVMTGLEMEQCEVPDKLTMLSYLSQIYDIFHGEIPHIKHPKLVPERKEDEPSPVARTSFNRHLATGQMVSILSRLTSPHSHRKRPSADRTADRSCTSTQYRTNTMPRRQAKRKSSDRVKPQLPNNEERQKQLEEIRQNRLERHIRRQYLLKLTTQQFYKSMQMLQSNAKPDEDSTPFEDYSIFLYRQTAPNFQDRVRELERKLLYPDSEEREQLEGQAGETNKEFSGRIKTIEEKLKGSKHMEKKPKDLLRAIGKIDKSDWNVKEIEKKIHENKMGRGSKRERPEKVPKWSHQQFVDKFQAVQSKLQHKNAAALEMTTERDKYAEIDVSLQKLGRKLKEGSVLDASGPRGSNKVSAMAEQFAVKTQTLEPESNPALLQKSNSRTTLVLPAQGGSESCHFCGKRVYLMERLSAVGKFFHRGCFRCEYCSTGLRLNNYAFDRDGKYGSRFFCTQHFGLQGKLRVRRKSDELKLGIGKENIPSKRMVPKTSEKAKSLSDVTPPRLDLGLGCDILDMRTTPERIEFENLAGAVSDVEEAPSEMDEDEWTDRNFGASAAEGSSDSASEFSDSEEEEEANEVFEEVMEQPLTAAETRRLAETWKRRHSRPTPLLAKQVDSSDPLQVEVLEDEEEESESLEYEDSDGEMSYHEYESDDDESDTATEGEGEEDAKARELRRLEVPVPTRPHGRDSDTGSDTEVASEYTSESESEEEIENSATEIETDSEFEHDGTTPTQPNIPAIMINHPNINYGRRQYVAEEPKRVHVRTCHIERPVNGTVCPQKPLGGVKLEISPLRPESDTKSVSLSNLTSGNNAINNNLNLRPPTVVAPIPIINPRRGDYFLNRTHSTEGIASKMSLELKKKYLLGASGLVGSVKKSGSASTLDSKVKSIVDVISEHQKLLNPAPEPSPTMQAFLQGTSNLRVVGSSIPHSPPSPTASTPTLKLPPSLSQQTVLLLRKQKELPHIGDNFEHICGLGKKEEPVEDNIIVKKQQAPSTLTSLVSEISSIANGSRENIDTKSPTTTQGPSRNPEQVEEADCRPRSPAHETSIVVPDIPWKATSKSVSGDDIESDSLSSDGSMSGLNEDEEESDEHQSRSHSPVILRERTPPRVEIHNSSGELMELESSDRKDVSIGITIDRDNKTVVSPVDADSREGRMVVEPLLFDGKRASLTSDRSSPSTPPSMPGDESESFHNEGTLAALTETELSDWAQDADAVVSEDLDDVEFNINPFVTLRRHRKTKTNRSMARGAGPNMFARIARGEDFGDFEDDPGHVCGKNKEEPNTTSCLLGNMENIEFMDTGEEDESDTDELLAATNTTLLKNSGYVQFVDTDDDIPTPIVEKTMQQLLSIPLIPTLVVSECETAETSDSPETAEALSHVEAINKELIVASAGEEEESSLQPEGTTTEETTTTSELATVKDNLGDTLTEGGGGEVFYTPLQEPQEESPEASPEDLNGQAYEDYVHRLQGRISPFSNVRDSIDIRKSRRRNGKVVQQPQSQERITEEIIQDVGTKLFSPAVSPTSFNSPSTSRKLEEISRERSKQKDLIHGMVMDRLLAQKKVSQERKSRRSRGPLSPTSSAPSSPFDSVANSETLFSGLSREAPTKDVVTLEMPSVALPVEIDDAENMRQSIHQDLEVPFVDDLVLVTKETEQFFTPLTSFKRLSQRHRPLSMHSSFRSAQRPLPDTPLTNPEAFSLPDIHKALFTTPVQQQQQDTKRTTERVREEARSRARLKSDEELGLSPEDYIRALKEKTGRRPTMERTNSEPTDKARVLDVTELGLGELQTSITSTSSATSNTSQSKATFYLEHLPPSIEDASPKDRKKTKDPERRKSIIQAVSEFFHKKKDSSASPSPPKTPTTSSQIAKERFRFKFTKSKDKGKSAYSSWSDDSDDKLSPTKAEEQAADMGRPQSLSEARSRRRVMMFHDTGESVPPPVPPPPTHYLGNGPGAPRISEDSFSEAEDDSRATALSTPSHDTETGSSVGSLNRRQSRMHRRLARQAQLKRLRMAQEIQRQLEEVEVKQRELESRGVSVEKALRGEGTTDGLDAGGHEDEAELLREWFDLVRDRSELRRYEHELLVRAEELELEDRHARLQQELRDRLAKDDSDKSGADVAKEGQILAEMLEIVERRDSLIALLEADRQRYQEEDRDLEAQMLAKGLRLTPLRKESHV